MCLVVLVVFILAAVTLRRVEDFHDFGRWCFKASLVFVGLHAVALFIK